MLAVSQGGATKLWIYRRGKKIYFARRYFVNRALGRLAEEFTVEVEKCRLLPFGRDDLAAKVEWVAETYGDGFGVDILSFEENDDIEQCIPVKTTGLGKHFVCVF
jgi:hypothetical protein